MLVIRRRRVFASKWLVAPRLRAFRGFTPGRSWSRSTLRFETRIPMHPTSTSRFEVGAGNGRRAAQFPIAAGVTRYGPRNSQPDSQTPILLVTPGSLRDSHSTPRAGTSPTSSVYSEAELPQGHGFPWLALSPKASHTGQGVMLAWQTLAHCASS